MSAERTERTSFVVSCLLQTLQQDLGNGHVDPSRLSKHQLGDNHRTVKGAWSVNRAIITRL